MATKVDRLSEGLLNEIAFKPEWKPLYEVLRHIIGVVNQTRERTGGDDDFIVEIQGDYIEAESPFNYDIRELQRDRNKYNAELKTERKIRTIESENSQLKAEVQTMRRQLSALNSKINQLIAEVETNA